MPLTQTALSMYKDQILCFSMVEVDILGTALWRCTILEGVSKNLGGGAGRVVVSQLDSPLNSTPSKRCDQPRFIETPTWYLQFEPPQIWRNMTQYSLTGPSFQFVST